MNATPARQSEKALASLAPTGSLPPYTGVTAIAIEPRFPLSGTAADRRPPQPRLRLATQDHASEPLCVETII